MRHRATHARRFLESLACAVVLAIVVERPAVGQPSSAAASPWQVAADRYLTGDGLGAAAIIMEMPVPDLQRAADLTFARWHGTQESPAADAGARRLAIRRLQASALLPLEILVAVTGRALPTAHEAALEDTARNAWRRLGAFDDEGDGAYAANVRRFRTLWRLALIQHLIGSSRFPDVPGEASAVHPPADDAEAGATLALLRGVALETRARLADEAPTGSASVSMRRLPALSRSGPMLMAMNEASQHYRRALELAPGDREVVLRLGRVALERDRLDEAERILAPLLSSPCVDSVCGLAHLFSGEVHEARKDPGQASLAYARASTVPAVRPPALVAMMQSLLRRGNARGAYDLTRQFATPAALAPAQPPDAWSQYLAGRLVQPDRVMAQLFAVVVP